MVVRVALLRAPLRCTPAWAQPLNQIRFVSLTLVSSVKSFLAKSNLCCMGYVISTYSNGVQFVVYSLDLREDAL